ncbi:MAG: SDR family NAD(P)-dependent oxidoreductase [Christensenellales bacterium]|jgi:NAD(P)-dependent dehydrogenase (short-subunit alcohol dehydrogenase family)
MANQVVWVAGASSGLGKATAEALAKAGWQVIAGARSFRGEQTADENGILRLSLDVTDQASVDAFIKTALNRLGTPQALVCAAGVLTLGPAAQYSDDEMLAVIDVSLMGALRLVRGALPLMIENGGGKVIAFSSINGLLPTPYQGAYVAAKHALEGYCECLRMENQDKGIQVMLVEPGDHQGGASKYRARARQTSPAYQASLDRVCAVIARDEGQGLSPAHLGQKVARALNKKRLPMRLRVASFSQRAAVVLHDILPNRLFLFLLSKYYKV